MPTPMNEEYLNRIKASIMDSFTDFIAIADTNRNIVYFNPAAYKMMGYGPDERPEIILTDQLHPKDFDKFAKEVIQPSVFTKGSWTGVSYINHKEGHLLTVEMTVFPLYGENKEKFGTVAVMRDINELTRMNERLQKSSELFQKVLDSTKIGIVLINMETNTIEMVNKCTQDMLQMSTEEILGKKCYDILCRRNIDLCPHVNERDKNVLVGERYIERKDGSFLPIIKTGTWITIDDKEYLVDTFVDITIQKNLEEKIHDAKIVAEAASQAKTEFLSRMSHEMRTPLNAIIGMTQIGSKINNIEKLRQCMDTIKISSNHLLNLINDILDLSKIEEGKLELAIEPFSIFAVVHNIVSLLDTKIREKLITLDMRIDSDIPQYLMGDALRLSQVLLNFMSNAVKFTPENGSICIAVTMNAKKNSSASLHFSVSDTGIGITDDQMARLFNPFVQADGSITRKYGGTGLGLVISKRIINLMGADIAVKTRYGEGTMFSCDIEFPIAPQDSSCTASDELVVDSHVGIFAGKKALIVDDVEVNRIIITELLADTGLAFDEASDGAQAVAMSCQTVYDVILMDIQMPVMDGYEATRKIRQAIAPFSDVPIVAMSANVFKEDVDRCVAEGMNAHIGKPVDVEKVVLTLYKLLNFDLTNKNNIEKHTYGTFNKDIESFYIDKNYFNIEIAMNLYGRSVSEIALLCDEFVNSDFLGKLKASMEKKDYVEAEYIIKNIIEKAQSISLTSIIAYSGNVKECIERKKYEYANMYLNDLEKCYNKTCSILLDLLLPGAIG